MLNLRENQIAANQVKDTYVPKTVQHADFSIQKIQSPLCRRANLSVHIKYTGRDCYATDATVQKHLRTCYRTESQWQVYVSPNSFSGARFQSPEKHTKKVYLHTVTTNPLPLLVCILFFRRV